MKKSPICGLDGLKNCGYFTHQNKVLIHSSLQQQRHSPELALMHALVFVEVRTTTERLLAVLALERFHSTVSDNVSFQLVGTIERTVAT